VGAEKTFRFPDGAPRRNGPLATTVIGEGKAKRARAPLQTPQALQLARGGVENRSVAGCLEILPVLSAAWGVSRNVAWNSSSYPLEESAIPTTALRCVYGEALGPRNSTVMPAPHRGFEMLILPPKGLLNHSRDDKDVGFHILTPRMLTRQGPLSPGGLLDARKEKQSLPKRRIRTA
jgi:hypothetical protein